MPKDSAPIAFDWDRGNLDKSYEKHGIAPNEAEEIFLDENILISSDKKHSSSEIRLRAIGKTAERTLFVVFTKRSNKIRIISARLANRKEKDIYEKNT